MPTREVLVPVLGRGYVPEHTLTREAARGQRRFPPAVVAQYPALSQRLVEEAPPGREWALAPLGRAEANLVAMGAPLPPELPWVRGPEWAAVSARALQGLEKAPPSPEEASQPTEAGFPSPEPSGGPLLAIAHPRPGSRPTRLDLRVLLDLETGDEMLTLAPGFEEAWAEAYDPEQARSAREAFDPNQPRDEAGKWTDADAQMNRLVDMLSGPLPQGPAPESTPRKYVSGAKSTVKLPSDVAAAFMATADQQRGDPEQAMLRIQHYHGGGVLNPVVEHVGDIIHRMSHWADKGEAYPVKDKVDKTLRWLDAGRFEDEHEQNIRSNAQYHKRDEKEYRGKLATLLTQYADEHAAVPVYNRPQWLARNAAVSVGRQQFGQARRALQELKQYSDLPPADWNRAALTFHRDADGRLIQYAPGMDEPSPSKREAEFDPAEHPRAAEGPHGGEFIKSGGNESLPKRLQHLPAAVAKAVDERPGRATHGHTAENAFIITPAGKIVQYNKWSTIPASERQGLATVHSHSADARHDPGGVEDFQPLNSRDIKSFLQNPAVVADAIIMADGRMEILEKKGDPSLYLALGKKTKKLDDMLHRPYAERSEYYEKHKGDPNYETYQQERELLRSFAKTYGLSYHENLTWKKLAREAQAPDLSRIRAAMVVPTEDGRVWAVQPDDLQAWVLPGGHLHDGEHPIDGAVREMHEETGVRAVPVKYLGLLTTDRTKTFVFLGHAVGQEEPETPEEVARVQLVPLTQLLDTDRQFLAPRLNFQEAAKKPSEDPKGGRWVTLRSGIHVYIRNGRVTHGPSGLVGKPLTHSALKGLRRTDRLRKSAKDLSGRYVKGAYGGHSRTSLGDVGEAVVMGVLGTQFGKPVTHVSAGKFASFPIDIIADGHALEVKTYTIEAVSPNPKGLVRDDMRMSKASKVDKIEMAKTLGLKPLMVGVLMDFKAKTATLFTKPGVGNYSFRAMERMGTVGIQQMLAKAPKFKPGHEALFKVLNTVGHSSELVTKWQRNAARYARKYQQEGIQARSV